MAYPERVTRNETEIARQFLDEVFPGAAIIPAQVPPGVRQRLDESGLGIAQVLESSGASCFATFIRYQTRHTRALEVIWQEEQAGNLPLGSQESAIDAIVNGEFAQEWGSYLPCLE